MRVHVVSDVHGRTDALARAGDGADALVCLGDLILFLDYHDHAVGILADMFGADAVGRMIALRSAGRFEEARAYSRGLWRRLDGDPWSFIKPAVRRQYAEMFAVLPTPTYLTYGNVDVPPLWREHAREGVHVLDGQTAVLGGRTFGFVGGGLPSPMRTPYEIDEEEYAAKVAAVGAVDVLCCHLPPDLPLLTYDVEARRFERGSAAILDAIRDTAPRLVLFGHVHQPLVGRARVHKTECVNVGYFRGTGAPFVLEWSG